MSVGDLIKVLERQTRVARDEIAAAPQNGRASWAAITSTTVAPLASALRDLPEIAALEGRWYDLPSGGGLINFDAVAVYLLNRAQKMKAETIVTDLVRLAADKSITFVEVRLIVGIKPTQIIELGDGFSLVPPVHAPVTDYSALLFSDQHQSPRRRGSPPTAALIRRSKYELRLQPPPGSATPVPPEPVTSEREWQAALRACVLVSDAAPEFRQHYHIVEDPGWVGMRSNGFGASESSPILERHASFFDETMVAALFQKLRPENKTLDLAINRLISSRCRLSHEERALDLGTCIEVLLMSGAQDNSEISYKIATRAAWLVGKDPADRLRCFEAARNLYSDRSTATHTGSLKAPRNMDEMNALIARLEASDNLCIQVITELLNRGVPKPAEWKRIILDLPALESGDETSANSV